MIYAYCEGMLDLQGSTLDPKWWQKVHIVTDYAARKLRTKLFEYKHDFNMALIGYDTEESTFKLHHQQSEMLRNSIAEELMPWVDVGPKTLKEAVGGMRAEYLKRFPDPRSEKGKEAIKKQLAIWQEQKRASKRPNLSKR